MKPALPNPAADLTGAPTSAQPWWRFAMVWLVLSGPAAVVVASIATAVVAWKYIDPVIGDEPAWVGKPAAGAAVTPATPALQARNHAATPAR